MKKKLLTAVLACTAMSLQANATEYSGQTFDNYNNYIGGVFSIGTGADKKFTFTDCSFTNNSAATAGAIGNYSPIGAEILNSTFKSNNSTDIDDGGGAIFAGSESITYINGSTFTGNTTNAGGGAIATRGSNYYTNGKEVNNSSAKLDIINSVFTGNNALAQNSGNGGNGGAIYNTFYNSQTNEGKATIISSTFTDNQAINGGAVYNSGYLDKNSAVVSAILDNNTFSGNSATKNGGAIYNASEAQILNSAFKDNFANNGGAIFNTGDLTIGAAGAKTYFTGNSARRIGGAIVNNAGTMNITNAVFDKNNSAIDGGAIYTTGVTHYTSEEDISVVNITDSTFTNNFITSADVGGAISGGRNSKLVIKGSTFDSNKAEKGWAGAIYTYAPDATSKGGAIDIQDSVFTNNEALGVGAVGLFAHSNLKNVLFENNKATASNDDGGGAVFLGAQANTIMDQVTFRGNVSNASGGAIATRTGDLANNQGAKLDITNSVFENNTAAKNGGAFQNAFYSSDADASKVNLDSVTFIGNTAGLNGGAVYEEFKTDKGNNYAAAMINNAQFANNTAGNSGGALYLAGNNAVKNSAFTNNSAAQNGGAIYTQSELELTDTSFVNNSAGNSGGAIWADDNLTINAVDSNIVMSGNTAQNGKDIYMNAKGTDLNINVAEGKTLAMDGGVAGEEYNLNINSDGTSTGSVTVAGEIANAVITVNAGTFDLVNGGALVNSKVAMADNTFLNTIDNVITAFGDTVTLGNNSRLAVDVNISNETADSFGASNASTVVTLTNVNPIGNTTKNYVDVDIANAMGINHSNLIVSDELQSKTFNILTPIRRLTGGVSEGGVLSLGPTGNGYNDFNPAIMASPVAAQLGGYLTQLNSYDEAFRNMDMYMLMTKKQRQAMKLRNRYAAADGGLVFDPTNYMQDNTSAWLRPYATFESVSLKGGPKVSNVAYGSFFGVDSELYDLGHGWDGMFSVYAGYNGSHQAYDGISIYQNGGTLGLVGMAYKDNFFTGLTINASANAGQASTMYGSDDFTMLMSGIASKTGYNFELADGKFIVQPNILLSYSFVNTFDYTNAAGVRINSDPLNAIQVEPGIKFIGNLKNGWQPYLGVSMVWNIMDKTDFKANDVSLPDLSVKPFVKYGVGVRKTWGERFAGFFQTYITNGGRNGVGLQAGFSWSLGKDYSNPIKSSNRTPKLDKPTVTMNNIK